MGTNSRTLPKTVILLVLLAIVCGAVVVVHYPALSARALSFDDGQYLTQNYLVQNPSLVSARTFLTEILAPSTVKGYYQPLSMISLMLDCAMGGNSDNLMPFHRSSLMLHVLNTALVVVLLYLLFGTPVIAAMAGLLFGLHPMTVDTIAWVSERKTLLAAFFSLWSLIFYVRYSRKKNWVAYLGCVIAYALALMSKPTSTTLPVVMLLMDFWPLKRFSFRTALEKIPLFLLAATSAIITYLSQNQTASTLHPDNYGPEHTPLVVCHNIVFYLYKIIWPVDISSHYAFPQPPSLSHPALLAGIIGTFVLLTILIISLRWSRAALTGWLVFFVLIFPAMGVIGFTNVIASNKFAYLPAIGLLMVLAAFLRRLCGANSKLLRRHIAVIIIVLVSGSIESVATRRYLHHWRDTVSLCEHMLSLTPNVSSIQSRMGLAFQSQGEFDKAIECYHKAIDIDPKNAVAHTNLGSVLLGRGQLKEASEEFLIALRYKPESEVAYYNLGLILEVQGKIEAAKAHYQQALHFNPRHDDAYRRLARVCLGQQDYEQAEINYRKLLQLKPYDFKANNDLAVSLIQQGKTEQAVEQWEKTLALDPDNANAYNIYFSLGIAMNQQGRNESAEQYFTKTLQLKPEYVEARLYLAKILKQQKKFEQAIEQYNEILRIEPANAEATRELAGISPKLNQTE
jgi:tetratricopeptide (TPR) repeat protein